MRVLARILTFTKELTPLYIGIVVCSLITSAAGLVTPFLIGRATDVVVGSVAGETPVDAATTTVLWLALALLAAELLGTATSSIGGYIGDVMSARMRAILSTRYFEKLLSLPQHYFDTELTGTIVNRLNRSIVETTQFLKSVANSFMTMFITTAAVLVVMGATAWPLALILLILFPTYVWLTSLTSRHWQKVEGKKNESIDRASGRFSEVVAQIPVVKSFVQERHEHESFARSFDRTVALTREQSTRWHLMDALRRSVLALAIFAMMAIILLRTVRGELSVGEMVLLVQLISMARQPVAMMSFIIDAGQHAIAGSRDYFAVIDMPDERTEFHASREATARAARESRTERASDAAVEFRGVTFRYDKDEESVLHEIDLAIKPGERVAFIGESGAGKTTLVSLILGLYPIEAGDLLVGGESMDDLPIEELRERVAVVFQDAALFSGTIRENIAYSKPDATDEEIIAAAKRANAHDFVSAFANGYDTVIGERGLRLSGGQRQRIAIARAILKDAPILVLDEATSALDTKSEREVQRGLDELMRGRTSLIVAHRLSTIADVDRIVTLQNGRIDEVGSPAQLAASGGLYAQLLALQSSTNREDRERLAAYEINL